MKILLYGELWGGTHIDSISKVLNKLGFENKAFNFYHYLNYYFKYELINKILRKTLRLANRKRINRSLLIEINKFSPTVLLISKGIDIYPQTLLKIKKKNILIANWNPDDFFNSKNSNKNIINSLGIYDIVFSSRKHLFDEYIRRGIKNPIYLEWYFLPEYHKRYKIDSKIIDKITFVGTHSKRREEIINKIDSNNSIEIWGSGWNKSKVISKSNVLYHRQILDQNKFSEVMQTSLININILTIENRDLTNLKIFEIVASGGILLTEKNQSSMEILGEHCFYFQGTQDINNMIKVIKSLSKKELLEYKEKTYSKIINEENSIDDKVKQMLNYLEV